MKFESGFEKMNREEKKARGENLKGLDAYKDFNCQPVDSLLEKRKSFSEEEINKQKERIRDLEEKENDGVLVIKK